MTRDMTHLEAHIGHLDALRNRLSNETTRLNSAKKAGEIAMRTVWVKKCQKELDDHIQFLATFGYVVEAQSAFNAADDELLAELGL